MIEALNSISQDEIKETLYVSYLLNASYDEKVILDALLVSQRYGPVVFIFPQAGETESDVIDKQGKIVYQLTNTLTQYPNLRQGRSLAVVPHAISIVDEQFETSGKCDDSIISTIGCLGQALERLAVDDGNKFYPALAESIARIAHIKPKKKRSNVQKPESRGTSIKKIEAEIANLDRTQTKAAIELARGPQRIRGLAGSGKTIVLAMKAAYVHALNPEWDIVVTFYTKALSQQYRGLIGKFYYDYSREEPDWEKIHIMHAWGSPNSGPGLYSEIAHSIGAMPYNLDNARHKYGDDNSFSGICHELNKIFSVNGEEKYDMILIDEAQDLPASFFKLAYAATRPPKRIVRLCL